MKLLVVNLHPVAQKYKGHRDTINDILFAIARYNYDIVKKIELPLFIEYFYNTAFRQGKEYGAHAKTIEIKQALGIVEKGGET